MLPAFTAGFSRALWIVLEISAAFPTALASRCHRKIAISRKASLMIRNACAAFSSDLTLFLSVHRSKTAF